MKTFSEGAKGSFIVGMMVLLSAVRSESAWYTDRAAWENAVASFAEVDDTQWNGGFASFDAGRTLNLPLSGFTVAFDRELFGAQVPTDWATWSDSNTPRVLLSADEKVTVSASGGISAFGLEMEPSTFEMFYLTLSHEGSSLTQPVHGDGGAAFFGWAGDPVNSFSLSISEGAPGFAFGRMVEGLGLRSKGSETPLPDGGHSFYLEAGGFLGVLVMARRLLCTGQAV